MYKVTEEFSAFLSQKEISHRKGENEKCSYVEVSNRGKNLATVTVNFFSFDDGNDVLIYTDDLLSVEPEAIPAALRLLNELNVGARFLKFVLKETSSIIAVADVPQMTKNPVEVCMEMLVRLVSAADEAYPMLLKVKFGWNDTPHAQEENHG